MSSDHRRTFLKQVGGLAAAAAAAAPLVKPATAEPQEVVLPPGPSRVREAAGATRVGLELDGSFAGWVDATQGGTATADVVTEKLGPDMIQKKHIGNVKYEDIKLQCGAGMSKNFFEWIKASFDYKYARRNGAIVTTDASFQEMSRISFFDALITEIGFPACDAASKDAAKLVIKISPESTQRSVGRGQKFSDDYKQQKWNTFDFKFTVDGVTAPRISKVDALTVKQVVISPEIGQERDYGQAKAYLEVPNLVVTLPDSDASDFYKWHEDFVIKGNCGQEQEKGATLSFLSPDRKDTLFSLSFDQVGIFKLENEVNAGSPDQARTLTVQMYSEEIKFDSHKS